MNRTLLALIAASFAFAAGSSFAQTPAEPVAAAAAVPAAAKSKAKPVKHSTHKATHTKVAHKKAPKTPAAA